ncbi:UNVERIFIED_CONTAM: hypothetical protein GTU68_034750 [Idotea baltica]|nr:hypothetical protein [Idotea baltica]
MDFDPFVLARIQFATNISFHILFPSITIGLAWILLYFRVRSTLSQDLAWEYAYNFWVKIFALTFALGVVTGITMSFQFGTNWPGFMEQAGNIAGPLLGYEVLTAFFLEAAFLGIMLFAGYILDNGVFYADDWWAVIFNPSFPYRFAHMMTACFLTSAFLIAGISAWRARQDVDGPATWKVMKTGIFMAAVLTPVQIFIGDLHGLNTLEHQPAKIAAMEAVWQTEREAAFTLIGFPDEEEKKTHFAIKIPYAASLILTHSLDGEIKGLNEFENEHPPVAIVFWAFRVMLGMGLLMLLVSWWTALQFIRKKDIGPKWLIVLSAMAFSGWIATLAGWYVTEIGRQPWVVYGLLKSADVVADHASATLTGTLFGYVFLYGFLLVSYIYTLKHLASKPAKSLSLLNNYLPTAPKREEN